MSSSWLGKKAKDVLHHSHSHSGSRNHSPLPSRAATPQPVVALEDEDTQPTGILTIRVFKGRGLSLPPGVPLPPDVEQAVLSRGTYDRTTKWWLPYVVLEYDKNAILINSGEGELSSPTWGGQKGIFDVSRTSDIVLTAYIRTHDSSQIESSTHTGDDILIARTEISPNLDPHNPTDLWFKATLGTGEFHVHITFKPSKEQLKVESFELLALIGKGSFGKVMQVKKKDTGRIYAMKSIRKAHIASRPGEITHILAERHVLALVNSPFIVSLKFSFQTPDKLYLVMPFVNGGELFHHLQAEGRFDERRSRFYIAELLLALEHLHSFNVVYRDLKPENILLSYTGHIALCDFGLCKTNMDKDSRTDTFCGTPEYIAPELLLARGYTRSVDWWTLGTLLFEFLTGLPPFYNEDVNKMYQRILHDTIRFPEGISRDARTLISLLLIRDPVQRLGANGADEIKRQAFFSSLEWKKLLAKKIQPPFKPRVRGLIDVSNFDPEFTSEAPSDSVVVDSNLSKTIQDQFDGFTYNPVNEYLGGESVPYASA